MNNRVMLTAFGKDKPGIVFSVAHRLFKNGCNIEDSTMTQLCGNFAMMMSVVLPEGATKESIGNDLRSLGNEQNLFITVNESAQPDGKPKSKRKKRKCMLTVIGSDKPGIVSKVTEILAKRNINITNIATRIVEDEDEEENDNTYIMIMELELARETKFSQLKFELSGLSEKLEVEINLDPIEDDFI